MNRRRCPRDPIAPERSKQESESWGGRPGAPSQGRPSRHSPPRQAWMKNIFGLFWRLGQLALSKSRNTSCSCQAKEGRREVKESGGPPESCAPPQRPALGRWQQRATQAGLKSVVCRLHTPEAPCRPHHRRRPPRRERGGPLCRSR